MDPFADAVAEEVAVFTPHAFDAFPRPKEGVEGEEGEGKEGEGGEARRRKKKSKGKKKQARAEAIDALAAAPTSAASATGSLPSAASAVSVGSAGSAEEESAGGGLLMPDSAEYLAMLEHRLERLKKKQETRAKATKTARRTSQPSAPLDLLHLHLPLPRFAAHVLSLLSPVCAQPSLCPSRRRRC